VRYGQDGQFSAQPAGHRFAAANSTKRKDLGIIIAAKAGSSNNYFAHAHRVIMLQMTNR
jgi:hypothetical protein